eukprot:TRINITY_DN40825_c0_g1_i1.p1 TRINITY_DN40825_c0_g1~~TRINITY_DN40825_c0_g1_i1.p1  ORF type:complete len:280 (-),score=43.23 TRINITY_DN40825_c0_g1_i1:100-891(-)
MAVARMATTCCWVLGLLALAHLTLCYDAGKLGLEAFSISATPAPRGGAQLVRANVQRSALLQQSQQSRCSSAALSLSLCLGLAAAVRGLSAGSRGAATSPITMFFRKRYGGSPAVKNDPDAEFGPQYHGPKPDWQIQRSARLGFPKGGQMRTIPKLSGSSWEYRKQLMRNLTTQLIRHGRIRTTRARAEALGYFVDRMILCAIRGDDLSRREAGEWMYDEKLVDNLFKLAPDRYPDQRKNFTKVTRTMNRKGDNAEMAYIELL